MRVVFAGTPEVAIPTLAALVSSRHDLVGVITRPDAPAKRGRSLMASPVAHWVAAQPELADLPVLKPNHPRDPEFQQALRDLAPDACPVVAYGALLPQSALDIPVHGWINLHFSVLPRWRGAAPVQYALWSGDEVTGATTFRIVKELDAGPTYGVMTQAIGAHDTAGSLLATLADGGAELLVQTLDGIDSGEIEEREQQAEGITFAPKVTVDDAQIDWSRQAEQIDHQIRAFTPAPGAWTLVHGERMKVGPIVVTPTEKQLLPGELFVEKNAVWVGTGTQPVQLGAVKAFGKKEMAAADWARGSRPENGSILG